MKNSNSMFYGAKPSTFEKAKMLRKNMTQHELILWEKLKSNRLNGLRFKAQHPIDCFVADFYCHVARLVIEIDGHSHDAKLLSDYDKGRTYELDQLGITVLRFKNKEIENQLEEVVQTIKTKVEELINKKML